MRIITDDQVRAIEAAQERLARKLSDAELKLRAELAPKKPIQRAAGSMAFVRNPAVAEYAKRLANGACDLCRTPAPFTFKQIPYLECHHVTWLSAGGDDTIDNTVALCPNCHRRMHLVNAKQDQQVLLARLAQRKATN